VKSQLERVQALERLFAEKPNAADELREAKAKLAELRIKYTDQHPMIRQQMERIKALESK